MMYLDLDELPEVFSRRWFWSSKRFGLAWFRRKDHLFKPKLDLKLELRQLILKETGQQQQGPIRVLTHLRYFGYCFNPISLYYCFDAQGKNVRFIVAEVHNTPWGQRHCYVLHNNLNKKSTSRLRFENKKTFHVSPFLHMKMDYHWRMTTPDKNLLCHIENHCEDKKIFDATLILRRQKITGLALAKILATYPLITFKIVILIYYQALRLWLKKVPYVPYSHNRNHTSTDSK